MRGHGPFPTLHHPFLSYYLYSQYSFLPFTTLFYPSPLFYTLTFFYPSTHFSTLLTFFYKPFLSAPSLPSPTFSILHHPVIRISRNSTPLSSPKGFGLSKVHYCIVCVIRILRNSMS